MTSISTSTPASGLLPRVCCPHCWEHFPPEAALWIAEHSDLLGDRRLGAEQSQRFLPTRFTVAGEAVDSKGFPCHGLACPNCHLSLPRALLEIEPLFLSIFGAPGSGKSYLLAAMTWVLRRVLPLKFKIGFADADPILNQNLNEYEESVFGGGDCRQPVPLADLIRKTEEQGDLYDSVSFGSQIVSYPRPFVFTLQPLSEHRHVAKAAKLARTLCLYDNAGESFQPGKDSAAAPVTRHMAQSRVLFFVFDPTQDSRFQQRMKSDTASVPSKVRTTRQDPILHEAIARVRRFAGLKQSEKHRRPLIVILTKFDCWWRLLNRKPIPEPWQRVGSPAGDGEPMYALDARAIEGQSQCVRQPLLELNPEIVTAAENFAENVTFVPVASVGWNVSIDAESGLPAINPADATPYWAAVPLIYGISRTIPGLIPTIARRGPGS